MYDFFKQSIPPTLQVFSSQNLHSLNVNSSKALRMHKPKAISSKAWQSPMPNIVNHVNPFKTFQNNPQRFDFIVCYFIQNLKNTYSGWTSSIASQSHTYNFFKQVNPPTLLVFSSKTCHLLKCNSSKALRVHIPEGHSSRASQFPMDNFYKQFNPPTLLVFSSKICIH